MCLLQELYRGEIRPDVENHPAGGELAEARNTYLRHRETLLKKIDAPMREEMETLLEERIEVTALEIEDAYIRGMRMGAQLMGELLAKKDRPSLT